MSSKIEFINSFTFMLLYTGSIFVYSHQFTDAYIVPKWFFFIGYTLLLGGYFSIQTLLHHPIKINLFFCYISIVLVSLLQASYGIAQHFDLFSSHSFYYKVTGSFDNPAGLSSCLCISFPFIFSFLKSYSKYLRYGICIIVIITIMLSHSRSGFLSICILLFVYIYDKNPKNKFIKNLLLFSLILILIGCYWVKKDSADGRLLIWLCCINMIKDAFWFGYGVGGFEAHYMDYQMIHFNHNPDSKYIMLAGNIKHSFNEYIELILNFGIIGLLILIIIIGLVLYCYKKKPSLKKR